MTRSHALPIATLLASLLAVPAFAAEKYSHEASEKLYRAGKYEEGEAMDKAAIADIEKAQGPKAWQLADPLNDLATIYMRQAKFADAKQLIERADTLLDKSKPDQGLIAGRLSINKGWRLYTLGETDQATKVFEEGLALIEKYSQGDSIDRAELINNLGLMYEELGEKSENEALIDQARICLLRGWEMRKALTGELSPETGESLNNLGMHLLFNGRSPSDALLGINVLRKSLEVAIKVYGENHPETAVSHGTLALALLLHDKTDEAEKEVRIAIPMTQKYLGDKHPDLSYELMTLGRILQKQGHFDDAEKKFLEAQQIDEEVYGKTHKNVLSSLKALKVLYDEKGDAAKSQEMEKRIDKLTGKDI